MVRGCEGARMCWWERAVALYVYDRTLHCIYIAASTPQPRRPTPPLAAVPALINVASMRPGSGVSASARRPGTAKGSVDKRRYVGNRMLQASEVAEDLNRTHR
jgi:hypothetical protein